MPSSSSVVVTVSEIRRIYVTSGHSASQSQTAVTVHLKSAQLLLSGFARRHRRAVHSERVGVARI